MKRLLMVVALVPCVAWAQSEFDPAPGAAITTQQGALPWEQGAKPAPAKPAPQPKPEPVVSAPKLEAPAPLPAKEESYESRESDDRKLNALAVEYYDVSPDGKNAVKAYDKLAGRVKGFINELKGRPYDVADLLDDAKKLQSRVAVSRKKAAAKQEADKAVKAVSR